MLRGLCILTLLLSLPCGAATVYKSVDARGRVTFSDSPTAQAVSVEKLVVEVQAASAPGLYLERMAAMTEVVDKIAGTRLQREKLRAQARAEAESRRQHSPAGAPGYGDYPPYAGYGGYAVAPRRYYRKRHHPAHPVFPPPGAQLPHAPLRGQPLVNSYPASLVRRSYGPHVAAVFQNRR